MDEAVGWIPCLEAVKMVDPDNLHDAMQAVAKRAAQGLVRARADIMITSTRTYRGSWSKPVRQADAAVPAWYWAECGNSEHPWGPHLAGAAMQGQGDNCGRSGLEAKVELFGVQFAELDILSMRPSAPPSARPSELNLPKGRGGAPRDSEKWDAVTLAIAQLANEGRLDRTLPQRFSSQSEMRRAILDSAALVGFDAKEETIKPLVAKVFREMLG